MTAVEVYQEPTTALSIRSDQEYWNDVQLSALRQLGLEKAPEGDLRVFFHQVKKTGLDPFAKQIYMIGRNSKNGERWETKWTIQTSIDGARLTAARSHDYGGNSKAEFTYNPNGGLVAAFVTVWRISSPHPFEGEAYWDEYVQLDKNGNPTPMWRKMGRTMLAKCAEMKALRKAFPADLSGVYLTEEMLQADDAAAPAAAVRPTQPALESPRSTPPPNVDENGEVVAVPPAATTRRPPPARRVVEAQSQQVAEPGNGTAAPADERDGVRAEIVEYARTLKLTKPQMAAVVTDIAFGPTEFDELTLDQLGYVYHALTEIEGGARRLVKTAAGWDVQPGGEAA